MAARAPPGKVEAGLWCAHLARGRGEQVAAVVKLKRRDHRFMCLDHLNEPLCVAVAGEGVVSAAGRAWLGCLAQAPSQGRRAFSTRGRGPFQQDPRLPG